MNIQKRETEQKKARILTPYLITVFVLTLFSIVCYLIFPHSTAFSDAIMKYIGGPIRAILATLTNYIPFSLAEAFLLFAPVLLVFAAYCAIRKYSASWRLTWVFVLRALALVCIVLIIFVLGFAGGYRAKGLDLKLGLERGDVSVEQLKNTAAFLADELNDIADDIGFLEKDFSVMPYTFREMTDKLNEAYLTLSKKYDFLQTFYSRPKPVILSEPWTYTHIAGVYTFFTGESNINVNFPEYTLPYTTAHEMAHQRGISREDEANFIAFLVCDASSDPYIRYSGYLSLYEYVSNALYGVDKDAYTEINSSLDLAIRYEMYSYSLFFEKYRENTVADISGSINDSYLQSQGTVGTRSYGMVVDLTCAYVESLAKDR